MLSLIKRSILLIALLFLPAMMACTQPVVDALIVMKGSTDTLQAKILADKSVLSKEFSPGSLIKHVIIPGKERDVWIKERDIYYISLTDHNGKQWEFTSIYRTAELKKIDAVNARLYEIVIDGKIRWYRLWEQDRYGHIAGATSYLFRENMDPVPLTLFANKKKKLRKLTEDMPELEPRIRAISENADIMEIIEAYNRAHTGKH